MRASKAIHAASVSRRQASPRIAPSTRARACESSGILVFSYVGWLCGAV